ncbi:MAG: aspartyl-tRNA synthetase [Actinomycetota bacterium]|jgi:aspartyl-tRNA synthetase|nr:aspartyl-tRNA synthetase [Actinomycetota bacterium]
MSMRTHYAGSLRASDEGTEVALCGWVAHRRDHGGVVFIDLRDREGIVQVVLDPTSPGCAEAHRLRSEYVIRVEGTVRRRPEGMVNAKEATGEIEVGVTALDVLNEAEPPPFPLDDRVEVDETLRLRHRYLDLRRARMTANLITRAKLVSAMRAAMDAAGFVDVETPTLTRSTPEGARDFLVPSRLMPGTFFALPQSPQLFKQMLMVAGLDRYYQVARCWRDEDLRADRQLEFTQLDVEASFVDQEDILGIVEEAVARGVEAVTGERPKPFPRLTWAEAMTRFGSDKPDTRFGMELCDLSALFADSGFNAFKGKGVAGLVVPGKGEMGRNQLDGLTDRAKSLGASGLVWMRVRDGSALEAPVVKFLSELEQDGLRTALSPSPGDLVLIVADPSLRRAQSLLGTLRVDLGAPERLDEPLAFTWVVEFPLFEALSGEGKPIPAHHPFTRPHPEDLDQLESDPLAVRSLAYDLVLNGIELGSGSVRIHDSDLQSKIFTLLGIEADVAQERFGFLLDAFRFGAPPHAGFAVGLDRLTMILTGESSIREVIAFPKTQSGSDPLTGAPASVDHIQLRDLGISLPKPK